MRALKGLAIVLAGLACACGGVKNKAESKKEAPVKAVSAYYIIEVAGIPTAPSMNKYVIELDKDLEGLTYDSLYVNGVPVEMMRMKNRPVVYGGSKTKNFTGVLNLKLIGRHQNERFELKLDSVYRKETIYLPATDSGEE